MQAASIRTRDRQAHVVIAVPELEIYRFRMKSVEAVLHTARIEVWLVSGNGGLDPLKEAMEPVRWLATTANARITRSEGRRPRRFALSSSTLAPYADEGFVGCDRRLPIGQHKPY
jgi:hypothetical protein